MDIVKVGPENLDEYGIGCVVNKKHPGNSVKMQWLSKRFEEGLRYFLVIDTNKKPLGILEYVPGEFAWRAVDAAGWLFIHCLWVYPTGQKIKGVGIQLIELCIDEARKQDAVGVAAMVSEGPWMSGPSVFLKNGFEQVGTEERFNLVAYRLREGTDPIFRDVAKNREKFQGLNLVYANQCPMHRKSAIDLACAAEEHKLELKVTVLDSPKEAQDGPTYFGVYGLVWNGTVLADHYVSATRIKNILRNTVLKTDTQ